MGNEKTYIIKCRTTSTGDIEQGDASIYSTDHIRPEQWSEIAAYAQKNPNNKIVILEGEQLDYSEKTLSLFLPLVELRNVYMPKSLIEAIKHNFRTIAYHEYLSSYGQMRTFVDIFKDYEVSHPITDVLEYDRAIALIGGGWGKKNLITSYFLDKIFKDKDIIRFNDGKFDVEAFCNGIINEDAIATNTYEAIMHQHAVYKLIYIIKLLLHVKKYASADELKDDIVTVIKPLVEDPDNKLGHDSEAFFDEMLEYLYFNSWPESINILTEFIKNINNKDIISEYHEIPGFCYPNSDPDINEIRCSYTIKSDKYPSARIIDNELSFCNPAFESYYDIYVHKEQYDWDLIKPLVLASKDYTTRKLTDNDWINLEACYINPCTDSAIVYPVKDFDLPIFSLNEGEITFLTKDEKAVLLGQLLEKYPCRVSDNTPENENEILVFGSDIDGRHDKKDAYVALNYGAVIDQAVGLQGRSYAIPVIPGDVEQIKRYVDDFIVFAKSHPEFHFIISPYFASITEYSDEEIAPLFSEAAKMENISLPSDFFMVIASNRVQV